ncbi:hypothetical protein DPMN_072007 [Dreissena polymorpha]|uniref:Uncharacterized protein n=1 Tax=Dreissena polymorpha TaxID=45954 RepID=A0A9D3Z5Q6_DREPO|nr:hypothetical protein DPMN_072007 [Dreissena polymorpha]
MRDTYATYNRLTLDKMAVNFTEPGPQDPIQVYTREPIQVYTREPIQVYTRDIKTLYRYTHETLRPYTGIHTRH